MMSSFIYIFVVPLVAAATPRFSKSPALAAKVLMILCQSPMQPGFKDRTPGVCQWWVMMGLVIVHTVIIPKIFIFFTVWSLITIKTLFVVIIISLSSASSSVMMLKMTPIFPRIASDSEDPSHARHCAIVATDAHPDPWPRMIWKPTNRENGWGPLGMGGPS